MRTTHRAAALLAGAAVAVTTLTAAPAQATATPADRSGSWLVHQLNADGVVYNKQYKFVDYGLTADTAFALKALGGHRTALRDIRRAVAAHVTSWTGTAGSGEVYAGSTAKAVVLAESTGADPRAFGGVDLVGQLEGQVSQDAPTVGRIQDTSQWGDNANTIGQAFAAEGLSRVGSGDAGSVIDFLLQQQCSAGYFRVGFTADKSAADQSCDGGDPKTTSAPDTDATALVVLSLESLPKQSTAVRTAVADAVGWLKRRQNDNGSFGGGTSTGRSNANSTGVAGWALGEAGACRPARAAARWVVKLQVPAGVAGTPLAGETGGIAYDRAAYKKAASEGITKTTRDQWRRATTQAAPALADLSLATCRAS